MLFRLQKYKKFESNSQPRLLEKRLTRCCFDCKSTKNLRAIHNFEVIEAYVSLLFRLQKYKKFESNSQRLWLTYYAFRMNAKTFKDARSAVEAWKSQYQIDDATGDSYLPAENFSNFTLLLAAMYKGQSQSVIQGTFNKLYALIQGTQEANYFKHLTTLHALLHKLLKKY